MKHERQLTTRQEWDEYAGEFQREVDRTLAELTSDIEAANLIIAEKYSINPDQGNEYAVDAVEHFNDSWPYFEERFLVIGKWLKPEVSVGDNGLFIKESEEDAFQAAESMGFSVYGSSEESTPPKIGLSLCVSDVHIKNALLSLQANILSFAELDKISLQYLRPGNLDVVSSDLSEFGEALQRADALVRLYTTHADSEFYRVSGRRQQQMIDSIIQSIEETLPKPETLDRLIAEITTQSIYLQNYNGLPLAQLNAKSEIPIDISGAVLGITTVDKSRLSHGETQKRYATPEECTLANDGLSLIIHPRKVNFDLPDYKGNFILPIQLADDITFELI